MGGGRYKYGAPPPTTTARALTRLPTHALVNNQPLAFKADRQVGRQTDRVQKQHGALHSLHHHHHTVCWTRAHSQPALHTNAPLKWQPAYYPTVGAKHTHTHTHPHPEGKSCSHITQPVRKSDKLLQIISHPGARAEFSRFWMWWGEIHSSSTSSNRTLLLHCY